MTAPALWMIIAFIASFIITWIVMPRIIAFAFKKELFDYPDERKIHHGAVPRLGGVAFFPVTLFVLTAIVVLSFSPIPELLHIKAYSGFKAEEHAVQLIFGLCAALILCVFGVADDLKGIRYRTKFLAQIVAAVLLCMSGLWLDDLHGVLGLHHVSAWIGWPLTIFAVVFITNAINFIDGIDGLASGLCSIALIYDVVLFMFIGQYDYALLAITLLGTLLPFLWYNIHGQAERHNKIFMGDTGSLFLGLVLGALGFAMNQNVAHSQITINPMIIAFAPMIVPCFDVLRVVFNRVRRHHSPFKPDKNHIHHKLLASGLAQHKVLGAVLGIGLTAIVVTLVLASFLNANVVILLDLVMWSIFNMWLTGHISTYREKVKNQEYKNETC